MQTENLFYDSGRPGRRLLVFGAIHGNEPAGTQAIRRVMKKIEEGELPLVQGSVRLVPICNPKAYEQKARFFKENLNRVFRKTTTPSSYEAHLANGLCELMEREADIFLDLHSTHAPGPVTVFLDFPTAENELFAAALGATYALLGWPAVYEHNAHGFDSYDTTRYAHVLGIPGIIIECGQHDDPQTVVHAEAALIRTLAHAGIIDSPQEPLPPPIRVRIKLLEKKIDAEDAFSQGWGHLDRIESGTEIATRANGERIVAQENCVILLPKHYAKAGDEWFYLGVIES
ncbi:succinylglutamate desuccinylase/aspartoacylase family protein [Candidatus Kaiserbacteria bacterium]|nr:succinylglutamate desuccinylase/aspartoacylase family protein [Candidatus Kaiserbacteria bacterium]